MKLSRQIKPISYLKAHTAEIVRTLGERQEPLIITQNGEAKVVIQDINGPLVQLTDGATCDWEEIYDYIYRHDVPGSADHVLNQSDIAFGSLAEFPERGSPRTGSMSVRIGSWDRPDRP